jgi:hypothetical protein
VYEPMHTCASSTDISKERCLSPLPIISTMASGDPTTAEGNWPHINLSSYDAGSPHYVLTEDQLSFQ